MSLVLCQVSFKGRFSGSRFDRRLAPRCVHTEPMVAAVGWSQHDADAQGIEYLAAAETIHRRTTGGPGSPMLVYSKMILKPKLSWRKEQSDRPISTLQNE